VSGGDAEQAGTEDDDMHGRTLGESGTSWEPIDLLTAS
jgi:hypothetical protein